MRLYPLTLPLLFLYFLGSSAPVLSQASVGSYDQLVELFRDWRTFEEPPLREGAPDYTAAAFAKRQPAYLSIIPWTLRRPVLHLALCSLTAL